MFPNVRLAMAWLHTWFGLVLGFVLMVVFFFGALSVFDREIDRWAVPATRFAPQPMPSYDHVLRPIFDGLQPRPQAVDAMRSRVDGPLPARFDTVQRLGVYRHHRDPLVGLSAAFSVPNAKRADQLIWALRSIDPRTGAALPDDQLKIGSRFFHPLHHTLMLSWKRLGTWIVGFAALAMLAALVSGVVMHRRIWRELFTFRPAKGLQRSTLDLHNLTGVVALPFHFFFAFTGLLISAALYVPVTQTQLLPLQRLHEQAASRDTGLPRARAGVAAPTASVDAMVAEAQRRWQARGMVGEVGFLALHHVGDANGYVSVFRAGTDRIALVGEGVHFQASTGALLREDPPRSAVASAHEFLTGLHLQHFRHWLLRWFYLLGGLAGCVCIATGFVFFVEKRKQHHARQGLQGARVVDAMAVTTVTGMLLATLGLLVANRVLPDQLPAGWPGRGDLQRYVFWSIWALAMGHAFWRSRAVASARANPAWREQCAAIAVLAAAAALLNWATTGDHLVRTLSAGHWPVAGVDLSLLATAVLATLVARRLWRPRSGVAQRPGAGRADGAETAHA
jgi:uncharacterized iron-regulated membrane protein